MSQLIGNEILGLSGITSNELVSECLKRTLDPSIAIENEVVQCAILRGSREDIRNALDNEF